jgi:hypothetical protein
MYYFGYINLVFLKKVIKIYVGKEMGLWTYFYGKTYSAEPNIFETEIPVKFSFHSDGAFEKYWKPWADRYYSYVKILSAIFTITLFLNIS